MKERDPHFFSRLFVLGFIAVLLCSVLYSRAARHVVLGEEFQYVPRESVLLAATGDIESLWGGVETHLNAALRATEEGESPLGMLKKILREEKIRIPRLEEARQWGLDIHRGLLFSAYRVTSQGGEFLAILPIADDKKFFRKLETELDIKPKEKFVWTDREGRSYKVYDVDGLLAAMPQPGICVVSPSEELLRRSLTLRSENLAHAAANDVLYQAIKRRLRGPLLTGASIFVYWQSRTAPFSERTGVFRLEPGEMRIETDIELAGAPVRAFDALRRRNTSDLDWARKLPPDTLAAVMVQDQNLSLYRNFLAEQIFRERLEIPDVTRSLFAVTDFEDGLPDGLLGLWGERKELEEVAADIRQQVRQSRDLALLNGALKEYRRRGGPPPSLADLERLNLLVPEKDSLFHRYPLLPEGAGHPEFGKQDFSTPAYERMLNGHKIRFIAPPITANDLEYRQDLKAIDPEDLKSDRYRMAYVFLDDSLWIATDVRDLERLTKPASQAGPGLETSPAFQTASARWTPGAKLQAFVGLDRVISLGLLNPGSDLESLVQAGLIDFKAYSTLGLEAAPSSDQQRLVIEASLHRGTSH
jgi:hypothetical protein